jgi:hypothetical protein
MIGNGDLRDMTDFLSNFISFRLNSGRTNEFGKDQCERGKACARSYEDIWGNANEASDADGDADAEGYF